MPALIETFSKRPPAKTLRGGRAYHCRCGRPVFFRNTLCVSCQSALGYEPNLGKICSIEPIPGTGHWRIVDGVRGASSAYWRCANLEAPAQCNWLVSDQDKEGKPHEFCIACRLNRTIPDLSNPENGTLWAKIEIAKRRLVSTLIALELPVTPKSEDPERGLAFDFLRSPKEGPRVMTSHGNGLITLNIEEARSSTREQVREAMNEPYRTVLGHLRHEVGHYYWDRLIYETSWIDEFRRLFGDERTDYGEALRRNYNEGPPADWPQHFVSSYASMHPWEDWAETWTHMLHIADSLATAMSFGLDPRRLDLEVEPFTPEDLYQPDEPGAERFLTFLNGFMTLTAVMNEMSRGMGHPDFYPYAMARAVVKKLHFIYVVIRAERERLKTLAEATAATN